jgi:hypothetical protein
MELNACPKRSARRESQGLKFLHEVAAVVGMNGSQQAQLDLVQRDVRSCCEATTQLSSKVDALQHGLSAVLKLLAHRGHPDSSLFSAAEVSCKRKRAEAASAVSPFDDDEIFGTVLDYVGYGEYFYVAGVCRRWRGRYISYCHANARANEKHKLRTLRSAVVSTAARLQLALNNGAKLTELDTEAYRSCCFSIAYVIPISSLEPIAVLTLLRVYGYQWDTDLYAGAAEKGDLELTKWLHQVSCPVLAPDRIAYECCCCMSSTAVSILQWLHALQPGWFNAVDEENIINKTALLSYAGESNNVAVMQWLRYELVTEWPSVAGIIFNDNERTIIPQWNVEAVIWALDNGLEFEFDCSKLDPEKQTNILHKEEAIVLWQWLHTESNRHRCTCSHAQ